MKTGWKNKPISEFAKTSAGGTPKKSNKAFYEGGDIPWLLSGEVGQGEITTAKNFITEEGLAGSSAKVFPSDSVLVAMYGATAGNAGILRFPAATNQAVCAVLPNTSYLPEYLYYYLLLAKQELIDQAVGNAQPNISQAKIKATKVPLPPLEEQKRVVAILDEAFAALDRARTHAETNLKNTRELFAALREQKLNSSQTGWSAAALGGMIQIKHGFAFKSEFFKTEGDHVLLTPGNYYEDGGYRDRGSKQKYYVGELPDGFVLKKGDMLVAMTEQAPGLLGSCILIPEDDRFLHNQRLGLIQPNNDVDWHSPFFSHVFNLAGFRKALSDTCSGIKVRHTSPKKIYEVEVPIPPTLKDQIEIASFLDDMKSELSNVEKQYEAKLHDLRDLRQSLLQKAFSGELT